MSNRTSSVSRRKFLQALTAAAVMPVAAKAAVADTQSTSTAQSDEPSTPAAPGTHRVLCANILLASSAHEGTPFAWAARKELCLNIMKQQQADIICTQEVLRVQAEDMAGAFSEYQAFGFPDSFMDQHPDDYHGVTKNVILFRKDRYELTTAGNYWLSETPLITGSVSWDALRGRHVNWVRLKDRTSGKEFRVLNTHFDHKGQEARVKQAEMIVKEAAQYAESFPQILTGDFNADIRHSAIKILLDAGWTDTYAAIHGPGDPGRTFHKMEGPAYAPKNDTGKIDFIFFRGTVEPKAAKILHDSADGKYPSDHYFVMSDVTL